MVLSPESAKNTDFDAITRSRSPDTFFSRSSFFGAPDTAMTLSLSVMHAGIPVVFDKDSAYCDANSPSSPMGEYFLKITVPLLSV